MSYSFGTKSRDNLNTCTDFLQACAEIVIRVKDHSILKGFRNETEQNDAYNATPQRSKLKWPHGKHNKLPSTAMDVQTYPRPDNEQDLREEQFYLLGLYRGVALALGGDLRTGADWDHDGEISDNGWDDLFHAEEKK